MAGDCTYNIHYANVDTFGNKNLLDRKQELAADSGIRKTTKDTTPTAAASSPYFELIDGVLFRKKLEKGFITYREVLDRDRQLNAIATFHQKRPGKHHTLEDTYRFVADNYWWEGMYFHIREYVQECQECQAQNKSQEVPAKPRVSKTLASHGNDVLCKLKSQWEEGLFCDITLKTRGRSFSAHRAVLAAVSEYFQEIFAEMDSSSSPQSDIDLTGFSEESFLPLLEFSYTSTLSLKLENLMEISAMARHFRMWAVVEACKAMQMEQGVTGGTGGVGGWGRAGTHCLRKETSPACCPSAGSVHLRFPDGQRDCSSVRAGMEGLPRKRKREWSSGEEDPADGCGSLRKRPPQSEEQLLDESFRLTLELSDESGTETPSKLPAPSLLKHGEMGEEEHPCSPIRRLKLMDFKSPSTKRKTSPRGLPAPSAEHSVSLTRRRSAPGPRSTPATARVEPLSHPKADSSLGARGVGGVGSPSVTPSSCPRSSQQRVGFMGAGQESSLVKQEEEEEEVQSADTLEKYRLLSVLGLQRKSLLPNPEELTGWRQRKRRCKLKVGSYSLSARRKPKASSSSPSCPLGTGNSPTVLNRLIKTEPPEPVGIGEMRPRRGALPLQPTLPRSRNPSSRPASLSPNHRELRRSVRGGGAPLPGLPTPCARTVEAGSRIPNRKSVQVKKEPSAVSVQSLALTTRHTHNHLQPKRGRTRDKLPARASGRAVRGQQCHSNKLEPQTVTQQKTGTRGSDRKPRKVQGTDRRAPQGVTRGARKAGRVGKRPGDRREGSGGDPRSSNLLRAIKDEPADPVPVSVPFALNTAKRQSKPPLKLLDPGFLFDLYRPVGSVKREEESVDICLTRSVSCRQPAVPRHTRRSLRDSLRFNRKQLQAKGGATAPLSRKMAASHVTVLKRGARDRPHRPALPKGGKEKVKGEVPKKLRKLLPLQRQRSALLQSIRTARLRRLRGVHGHAPASSHTCLQCSATYRNCEALIMHRIRHVEGKHWPCPLCSKTFFRQRNVLNHIRTHDQKLYKCRSCMSAS